MANRSHTERSIRRAGGILAAYALAICAAGCGVSLRGADTAHVSTQAASVSTSSVSRLAPRPQGEVDIDGQTRNSLTPTAVAGYEGLGARIVLSNHGEAQGFAELCRGQTDIVDSRQPISSTELSICQAEGVQPVQLQVAANGVVLAAGTEVDVGADCLTLAQVKESFQAGSQITNWSQLGYYDIPLRVAGLGEGGNLFALFDETALDAPNASLANIRGDYEALESEGAVRNTVTNETGATNAQLHSNALASLSALRRSIGEAHQFLNQASFQVAKGIRDKRSSRAKARDNINLARARANLSTLLNDLPSAERYVHQTAIATQRFQRKLGTLGYFSLAYYEDHQEQLRAFEIDSGSLRPQLNCIFPSAQTISDGSYPLSRPLLLTVSLQDMRRPEVRGFLRFYLSHAPSMAAAAQLVSLQASTLSNEISWIDGKHQPPVITYAPPTETAATASQTNPATQPNVLVPAGGAGDEVSAADVPTNNAGGSVLNTKEASGIGEVPASANTGSQSSQPLIAGQ